MVNVIDHSLVFAIHIDGMGTVLRRCWVEGQVLIEKTNYQIIFFQAGQSGFISGKTQC